MRIVLDTNCLIQSISPHSEFRPVWDSLMSGENTLCITNEILEEYVEILQRLFTPQFAEVVVVAILKNPFVEHITPYYRFNLITVDPDDNKFVDCAIVANAHYIVTNDRHYDVLREIQFPSVDVIALRDFLELLHQ
ncbi:MAG: putative toxin-antitoxin system toxin component, PIN family [Bacteroidales bacterium]|nr:putative toxin-antitoxin system toxin component, PIN family [Bacteroidales bacterium]